MKEVIEYCLCCRKNTPHVEYIEDDQMEYNGLMVPYTDHGYCCTRCGEQYTRPEDYDSIMCEIRETYNQMYRG